MSFWDTADFAFQHGAQDSINDNIWLESAKIHEKVGFKPPEISASGYGAQQAMLPDGSVLPWVPDVLGSEWDHPEAVHIVGMAYAGFIREISNRCFPLEEYVRASKGNWRDFARAYLSLVICGDEAYYEPLCPLLKYFGSKSRSCLFDLCRASLVKREVGRPHDRLIPQPKKTDPLSQKCGASYCELSESQQWTWDRLSSGFATEAKSAARAVIVLGFVAEHGLLNLFQEKGQYVWDASSHKQWNRHRDSASPLWTWHYAGSGRDWHDTLKLGRRLQPHPPTWWCVGPSFGDVRWRVIPVCHPSKVSRYDPRYRRTLKLLSTVTSGSGGL